MKKLNKKVSVFLSLICLLVFSSGLLTVNAASNGAPAKPVLTHNNWDGNYNYTLEMNIWWGNNGTSWKVYENDTLIHEAPITDNSPSAQKATLEISGKAKGTYVYKCELINSYGKTLSDTITVNVTKDAPVINIPGIPSNVKAIAASDSIINVTWNSVESATAYDIEVDGKVIENVTSPYSHTGLVAESAHNYKVRAKNSKGASDWSAVATATTAKVELPSIPANLAAKSANSTSITVTWDKVANATSYELTVDGKVVALDTNSYSHTGLTANTNHTYKVRSINKLGASEWTKEIACTTLPDGGGTLPSDGLPERVLVGYWHNFDNKSTTTRLKDVSPDWDVIQVAFAESASDHATMNFKPYNATPEEFKKEIQLLQSKGKKVLISIGGQNGTVELTTAAKKDAFIKTMSDIIDYYGFDGLDIDLEGGCVSLDPGDTDFANPKTPKNVNLISATKELCKKYGSKFLLTMAPEITYVQGGIEAFSGPWGAYLSVIHGLRNELTFLHVQHYNHGSQRALDGNMYTQGTADFQVAMTEMMISGFNVGGDPTKFFPGLPASKVIIGLPASKEAAGGGYTPVPEVIKALDYLILGKDFGGKYKLRNPQGYKQFRGLMTWSINWDEYNSYEFSKNYREYFNKLK